MYEQNLGPLPDGDFRTVFADQLADIERIFQPSPPEKIRSTTVLQWANLDIQLHFAMICRRLLLPGSGVLGIDRIAELTHLAAFGHSCMLCLNHRSNLDVPALHVLLDDQTHWDLFRRLIWISGRKLEEDVGPTKMLVQAFNRVIVTPRSWMNANHSDQELHEAHQINIAAHRVIRELRNQGWVFALFPTATRTRQQDASTTHAIEETDSYLKSFEFMQLARIDGCTLPVSRDRDLTHEVPTLDRMRYTFGQVLRTDEWRAGAVERFPELDQRTASAQAIIEDIAAIDSADSGNCEVGSFGDSEKAPPGTGHTSSRLSMAGVPGTSLVAPSSASSDCKLTSTSLAAS